MDMKTKLPALPAAQYGVSLIEVMVAMFVLAIGVLAMMAAQLRAAQQVQESENQTIVAQEAQSLMEGMLINPRLTQTDNKYAKHYDHYKAANVSNNCFSAATASSDINYPINNSGLSRQQVANIQLCRFFHNVNRKLVNAQLTKNDLKVCSANLTVSPPTCTNTDTGGYLIQVTWRMQTDEYTNASDTGASEYVFNLPIRD